MSSKAKAKAKGVSASSFLDLKAELSKQEDEFSRNKAAGKAKYVVGGVKRPEKKPTVWARQNKGVSARASHDIELEAISKPTLESARAALERKAKIYDKLKRGQTGGLNDKQYESLLVDFDSKPVSDFDSDSDDVDESLEIARPHPDDDDPIVEYEDEFGRMRTARRSEVPRNVVPTPEEEAYDEDEHLIIRNPVGHFPVYQPSADRIAQVEKEYSDANNPLGVHYDGSGEVRAKGAGFYQFSTDEETRKAQMDELKSARDETEKTRQESGALDVRPGEVEGMQSTSSGRSRAMEKRKRELEERRKMVDAKRRKLTGAQDTSASGTAVAEPDATVSPPLSASADPFAALEVAAAKEKGKSKSSSTDNDADTFLAQLQQEFLSGKSK
ncbi:hypothetical protein B0H15DRAFT_795014 [Mycena belliarum]|uniref:Uncharacterized protein n=1 Tax=Mycena belliarum TaxID=1033014 RepID=A0AAD6UJF5_9AGAR|nr:hypothetical protein B0H15DRAFT_795014 [Mycena belliae]